MLKITIQMLAQNTSKTIYCIGFWEPKAKPKSPSPLFNKKKYNKPEASVVKLAVNKLSTVIS